MWYVHDSDATAAAADAADEGRSDRCARFVVPHKRINNPYRDLATTMRMKRTCHGQECHTHMLGGGGEGQLGALGFSAAVL